MMKLRSIALLSLFALLLAACGAAGSASVWNDVPRMEGLQDSEVELSAAAQVFMQTMLAMQGNAGQPDVAAFSTDSTVEKVQAFYTDERMGAAGWDISEGVESCFADENNEAGGLGLFCVYGKDQGSTHVGLMIIATHNSAANNTDVFFVRVES